MYTQVGTTSKAAGAPPHIDLTDEQVPPHIELTDEQVHSGVAEAGEPVQLTKRQKRQRRAQRQQYAQYRIFVDPNDAEADFA